MKTAWLNLRHESGHRYESFKAGLQKHGYKVEPQISFTPGKNDIFVSWNRIGSGEIAAKLFEREKLPVIVAENASWGKQFHGRTWTTLARGAHNTAGRFPVGGPDRWDSLGVELKPWRTGKGETVILAQRGIGSSPTAMPKSWPHEASEKYKGRIRKHPGNSKNFLPLEKDLEKSNRVVTWGSSSAVLALMMGIPVISEMKNWIGACESTDEGRLNMLRALAWAQWLEEDISSGFAFERLLG